MGKPIILSVVVAALLLAPCHSQAQVQVFAYDPVPGAASPFVFNAFMQLYDNPETYNLHSSIDIALPEGEPVYPPIEPGTTCVVNKIGATFVTLAGETQQNGDYAACILLHLYPNTNLTLESQIGPETCVGNICGDHLDFQLILTPDSNIGDDDVRSPRRHSLCYVGWLNADSTPPEITQNTVVHTAPVGSLSVWQIWAADPAEGSSPLYYNGIGGMQLMIDGDVVDEFDFDRFVSKEGDIPAVPDDFYFDPEPPDYGQNPCNDPNMLQYKLQWTAPDDLEHVWRLRWWDARDDSDEGDPENPPVAPLLAGEMGGDIWFEDGVMRTAIRWRVACLGEIDHFDVLRGPNSDGSYTQSNLESIMAIDGQMDYEFADSLPRVGVPERGPVGRGHA